MGPCKKLSAEKIHQKYLGQVQAVNVHRARQADSLYITDNGQV